MQIKSIFIDTSVLVRHYRDRKQGNTFFEQLRQDYDKFYISAIVLAEIIVGTKDNMLEFWDDLFKRFVIVPFTQETAMKTREIVFQLKRKSMLIELADMMIAATAIENDLPLATFNCEHFERIDGLQLLTLKQLKTAN